MSAWQLGYETIFLQSKQASPFQKEGYRSSESQRRRGYASPTTAFLVHMRQSHMDPW